MTLQINRVQDRDLTLVEDWSISEKLAEIKPPFKRKSNSTSNTSGPIVSQLSLTTALCHQHRLQQLRWYGSGKGLH